MTKKEQQPGPRLFVAINIPRNPTLENVLTWLATLGRAVRPVEPGTIHLTLKFYGNVADELVPVLIERLDDLAANCNPFAWHLCGTGAFPTLQRPSVIWAGVDDDGRFGELAEAIEQFSTPLGFARERRPFTPHVTLARVKFRPPPELAELLEKTATKDFGPQHTTSIILMQSRPEARGYVYTPVHTATFATR